MCASRAARGALPRRRMVLAAIAAVAAGALAPTVGAVAPTGVQNASFEGGLAGWTTTVTSNDPDNPGQRVADCSVPTKSFLSKHVREAALWAFVLVNLGAIVALPGWETVPFHFAWIGVALAYGLFSWNGPHTAIALAILGGSSLVAFFAAGIAEHHPRELVEVPLMAVLFLVMV